MGLPALEAEVLAYRFSEEFKSAKAPYYGVNIIDVNKNNWDAFIEATKKTHEGVIDSLGGRSHLWSVRDHGERKRVLWICYYPDNIGEKQTLEIYQLPAVRDYWVGYIALVERWEWFVTSEEPSATPI